MFFGDPYEYGYGYRSSADTMAVLGVLAVILALVGTILLLVLVTPEKRRAGLNKFFRVVADIFTFRGLVLEYILRALYIFETLLVILLGFFGMFQDPLGGLLTMLLGPIVLRIVFELFMMAILAVKNLIQINNKLPGKSEDPMKMPDFTAPTPEPQMVFCAHCGTRYDASKGGCPNGCKD